MVGQKKLSLLIEQIYESADNPELWEPFVQNLTSTFRANMGALFWRNASNQRYDCAGLSGVPNEYLRLYTQRYGAMDEWFIRGAHILKTGWVGTGQSLCPESVLLSSEFYSDFLKDFDVFHQCGVVIARTASEEGLLTVLRPRRRKEFSDQHVQLLSLLLPHLQRAIQIHGKMSALRNQGESLETALHRIDFGVVLLDFYGTVKFLNRAAESMCAKRDGLAMRSGKLVATVDRENATLQELIRSVREHNFNNEANGGGAILLSRAKKSPLSALVVPNHSTSLPAAGLSSAVVFISDPDELHAISRPVLKMFGLTRSESRIVEQLVNGRSLKEACEVCAITHNTGRSHLKTIFQKTNVNRQSQLLKLLMPYLLDERPKS